MSGIASNQVLEWREAWKRLSPAAPDVPDLREAPHVVSASMAEVKNGVGLRLHALHDGQILSVDLNLNAVAARAIAAAIQAAGKSAGWLDQDGELVIAEENGSPDH